MEMKYIILSLLLLSCESYNDKDSGDNVGKDSDKPVLTETGGNTSDVTDQGGGSDLDNSSSEEESDDDRTDGNGTIDPITDDLVPDEKFSLEGMVRDLSERVVSRNLQQFSEHSSLLAQHIESYCKMPDSASRLSAQTAWADTMYQWQKLEMMRLKPFNDPVNPIGEHIYSFQLRTFPVSVFRDATKFYDDSSLGVNDLKVQLKGLNAIQAILFDANEVGAVCRNFAREARDYTGRSEADKHAIDCNYMNLVMQDISTRIMQLRQAWTGSDAAYDSTLIAGNLKDSANEFSDAMFYLSKEVKDEKIAMPAGINEACRSSSCPCEGELILSGQSLNSIKANMIGFQELYYGNIEGENSGLGFDDYLKNEGQEELSSKLADRIKSVVRKLSEVEDVSLFEMAVSMNKNNCDSNPNLDLCIIYQEVKIVTDLLKNDFIQALSLSPPSRAQGDND